MRLEKDSQDLEMLFEVDGQDVSQLEKFDNYQQFYGTSGARTNRVERDRLANQNLL